MDRFSKDDNGVITDTKTGLQWYVGPDRDTTWDEADAWVKKLTVASGGWRLPTLNELEGIYEKDKGRNGNIDKVFRNKNISLWVWSNETQGSSSAWFFYFDTGYRGWYYRNPSSKRRAFAVHGGR